ncbi:MAG: GAF domain-containing protein [Bacteroidota bacterium]|nr:GAF domain-containing protein [Bacteroidota bacterium]MDP4237521.1 GAF domain-containing protein [Bacteroidota bacterium]
MWDRLIQDLDTLLDVSDHPVTTLANSAAFLFRNLERINWLGFYLCDANELYLGPFGGKPACTKIEMGKGVCGTSALRKETIVVDEVEKFPGHIACDPDSRSEIVIPLLSANGELFGVLDVDSAELSRFGNEEKAMLEMAAAIIARKLRTV